MNFSGIWKIKYERDKNLPSFVDLKCVWPCQALYRSLRSGARRADEPDRRASERGTTPAAREHWLPQVLVHILN